MNTLIEVLPASHVDHGLTEEQLAWLLQEASGQLPAAGLLKLSLLLPAHIESAPCGLYGPMMGDDPVGDDAVRLEVRGERRGPSRLIDAPLRPQRWVSVIAGPHDGHPWVLFTAFGGPISPREPFDVPETDEEALAESRAFWAKHALSG